MTERMLRFVTLETEPPEKREAGARTGDFQEVYAGYAAAKAAEQAARCSQCGVPFCQVHCPLQNNIPDWLKLTAEGRIEEAYELSQSTNNMPEICGRICPQDRLCEGNCVIETSGHGTVTIGAIEKHLTETAWANGWVKPLKPRRLLNASVGIIGAGPAGLAAAEELRRAGYRIAIYDRHDRAGGLLIYGIPNFKLEKEIVQRRIKRLEDGGIVFKLGVEIGRDMSFADLRSSHDAVFVAAGAYRAKAMEAPGVGLKRIVAALDYLIASNRKGLGDDVPAFESGALDAKGKHVAVIGGGDTANAEEEGIVFEWLTLPKAFLGKKNVEGVRLTRSRLGLPDASGRKAPEEVKGSEFNLHADLVIQALGFDVEDLPAKFDAPGLGVTRWGTLAADNSQTTMEGVFAGGDVTRGASLVVWAIKDGRDAAAAIHKYLAAKTAMTREAAE